MELELIHRRFYQLQSRNLHVGVWDANKGGFYGIRFKFGNEFIDFEYNYTLEPPYGTATATKDLGVELSGEIRLSCSLDSICRYCEDRVFGVWEEDSSFYSGRRCTGYKHYTNPTCEHEGTHMSVLPPNLELYNVCKEVEDSLSSNL